MTLPEIIEASYYKYPDLSTDCRLTRMRKKEKRAMYVERLKVKYGLVKADGNCKLA
jgi:hypothetical protein